MCVPMSTILGQWSPSEFRQARRAFPMCNDLPYSDYLAAFSQIRIAVKWPNAAPNLEPRDDIWPTDKAPVIRRIEDGTNEFTEIRWVSTRSAKTSAGHQLPVRGETLPGRSMSGARVVLLRVHRDEVAEGEVAVHQNR